MTSGENSMTRMDRCLTVNFDGLPGGFEVPGVADTAWETAVASLAATEGVDPPLKLSLAGVDRDPGAKFLGAGKEEAESLLGVVEAEKVLILSFLSRWSSRPCSRE